MAQTCFAIPTGTTNAVSISHGQYITSSVWTSTAPGLVSSSVISTCTPVAQTGPTVTGSGATPPGPSCVPVFYTVYTTYPGSTTVVTVPATVVVDYTVTNPVTLFGTTCSTIPIFTSQPVTPTPSPTTVTPTFFTSTSYSSSTSTRRETSYSIFTPPPSTAVVGVTSTSRSLSSTITSSITSTSTFAPSQTAAAAVISGQKKSIPIGPIVGGVLGGLVALLLLGFIAWKLIKRPTTNDTFNANYHHNHITGNPEPKQFGPVGTISPPQPPIQGFNDIGPRSSQIPAHHHYRRQSQVPLLGAIGLAGSGEGAAGVFNQSRPASSVSQQPIGPMITQVPQDQTQRYPTSGYPLQNWAVNQGASQNYGGGNMQGGYNPQGVPSGPGQAIGSVPTSSLARNPSVSSIASVPSMYTTSSWHDGTTGPHQPPPMPIIGG